MSEKEILYNELQYLRKQVKENDKAMEYLEHLKDLNKDDVLYGWVFEDYAILEDTLEDLDLYQDSYVRDILRTYIGELETILYKMNILVKPNIE